MSYTLFYSSIFVQEAEIKCRLMMEKGEDKVVVAHGTMRAPVVPGLTIHTVPMPPDHARVTVDGVVDADFLDTPLPFPIGEHEVIQEVLGSFAAWPMSLILTGLDEVYYY